jgi:hypothetical protein
MPDFLRQPTGRWANKRRAIGRRPKGVVGTDFSSSPSKHERPRDGLLLGIVYGFYANERLAAGMFMNLYY